MRTLEEVVVCIERVLKSFKDDPPSTDYQEGFLAAIESVERLIQEENDDGVEEREVTEE